jgi:hypothetical protein
MASLKSLPPWTAADLAQWEEDVAATKHQLETLAWAQPVSLAAEAMRMDGMRRAVRSLARLRGLLTEAEA